MQLPAGADERKPGRMEGVMTACGPLTWDAYALLAAIIYAAYLAGHVAGFEKGRKVW